MKKTIAMFIVAALGLTVFASCDLGNGLVSELLGELNREDLLVNPSDDYVVNYPDEPWGTVEVTLQPYDPPIEETVEEYWSEDISYDEVPIDPSPWPDANYRLDLSMDGDLSDWNDGICTPKQFGKDNLEAWLGELDEQDGFTLRVAADTEYVYFAIEVFDENFLYSDDGTYNKDAFQIAMDFNGWFASTEFFERAIFYSFGIQRDGTMDVTVQCIHGDAQANVDYVMASDDDPATKEGEIMGVTRINDYATGWIAEYAISIETLYRDAVLKLQEAELDVPEIENPEYLQLRMLVCYLDHTMDDRANDMGTTCAYGTPKKLGSLQNGEGWYPEYAGVTVDLYPMWGQGNIEYAWN